MIFLKGIARTTGDQAVWQVTVEQREGAGERGGPVGTDWRDGDVAADRFQSV